MSPRRHERRAAHNPKKLLRGHDQREIPFTQPGSTTKIFAIASGKGGVGKPSVTANLAVALAGQGLSVGLLDADVYGHSIPRILGATNLRPWSRNADATAAHGVRIMSMLPFKPGGVETPVLCGRCCTEPSSSSCPMCGGEISTSCFWTRLGTGDIAISTAQLLPHAEIIVVTTPQLGSSDVAVRAGTLAEQTHQKVLGVVENMSSFPCPHCGEPLDLFGVGGGDLVAEQLTSTLGTEVPVLGKIPFDPRLREGGDSGKPLVISEPQASASIALTDIAAHLGARPRGLAGIQLCISPTGR